MDDTEDAPVSNVRWIPIDKVMPNDYNPNQVAKPELRLLYTSIKHDGYTQPIVTVYDEAKDEYVIVDGFHRYHIMRAYKDIYDQYHGRLPVVVISKGIKDRMASTVRHNRARGKHSVGGMGILVIQLSEKGWTDESICNELGIEPDEMLRLKHTSGIAELYKNREFGRSWEEVQTIRDRKELSGG